MAGNDPEQARPDAYSDPSEPFPTTLGNNADPERLHEITNQWGSDVVATADPGVRLNHSHSLTMGGQTRLFGRPLGLNGSFTYRRNFRHYSDGVRGGYILVGDVDSNDELGRQFEFDPEINSQEDITLGGLMMVSYKPTDNTKVRAFYMHNRNANLQSMLQDGTFSADGAGVDRRNFVSSYRMRAIQTGFFSIEQVIPALNNLKIEALGSYTDAIQEEPDLRFFSDNFEVNPITGEGEYVVNRSQTFLPTRFYRDMNETNIDARLNIEYPFEMSNQTGGIKFGGAYTSKTREFNEDRYEYDFNDEFRRGYNGDPLYLFNPDTLGYIDTTENGQFDADIPNVWQNDRSLPNNFYSASQTIIAGFAMADLPITRRFRALIGLRVETTDINVENASVLDDDQGQVQQVDFLPSLNLVYAVRENMNLRASYGRSIARPTFRELAPFASFQFLGDFILIGNPALDRTLIDNAELRWEWFPDVGEILSFGVFYKHLTNPIERVLRVQTDQVEIQYDNVPQAQVYGAEFEVRKKLGFIWSGLKDFKVGFNASYIFSEVDISEQELIQIRSQDPDAETTRTMFMQSPYVINARLGYNSQKIGLDANLVFNVFGPRLATVSRGAAPNIFEQPRPSLDLILSQNLGFVGGKFAENWNINLRATNLFNPEYLMTQEYKGQEYVFQKYTIGRTFTLGVNYTIN